MSKRNSTYAFGHLEGSDDENTSQYQDMNWQTRKKKVQSCPKWKYVKMKRCKYCDKNTFGLACKHIGPEDEFGDYECYKCKQDCNWFWHCRNKGCNAFDDDVDGVDIDD